jgi:hypothetical protein
MGQAIGGPDYFIRLACRESTVTDGRVVISCVAEDSTQNLCDGPRCPSCVAETQLTAQVFDSSPRLLFCL